MVAHARAIPPCPRSGSGPVSPAGMHTLLLASVGAPSGSASRWAARQPCHGALGTPAPPASPPAVRSPLPVPAHHCRAMPRLCRQPWSAIQPNSAQGPKDRWTQGSWAAGPPASSALTPAAAPRSTEGDAQQGSVEAKPLAVAPTPAAAKGVIADSGDSYKALIKVASLLGAAGLLLLAKARLGMWRGAAAGKGLRLLLPAA